MSRFIKIHNNTFKDLQKNLEATSYSSFITGNTFNIFKHFRLIEKRSTFSSHKAMPYSSIQNMYRAKSNRIINKNNRSTIDI